MKNNEFKVMISILSLVIALAIFLAGFTLYNKLGIIEPLTNELESIKAVKEVNVIKENDYTIKVTLNQVNNFDEVYNDIKKIVEKKLNDKPYEIILVDYPNAKLNERYVSLQPAIYQALANHEFVWLNGELAKKTDITYTLLIDDNYLYIQLVDGDFYIYKVIKRTEDTKVH